MKTAGPHPPSTIHPMAMCVALPCGPEAGTLRRPITAAEAPCQSPSSSDVSADRRMKSANGTVHYRTGGRIS